MPRTKGSLGKNTKRILEAVQTFLSPDSPVTVRYCLYRLISMGVLESTKQYTTLSVTLNQARVNGTIEDECFVDNKRKTDRPSAWDSLAEYKELCRNSYRRNLWQDQPARVEVWLEKDTSAFLVKNVTRKWNVPLRISSGFYSRRFLYQAAAEIAAEINPIYILYIGDFDPSGLCVEESAQSGNGFDGAARKEGLREILLQQFSWKPDRFDEQVSWNRLAITETDFLALPDTAKVPIKQDGMNEDGDAKRGDPRAAAFREQYGEYGAEVEALEVVQEGLLADRLENAVTQHIDFDIWNASLEQEQADLESLRAA